MDEQSGASNTSSSRIPPPYICRILISPHTHIFLPYNVAGFAQHVVQDLSMLGLTGAPPLPCNSYPSISP